MEPDKVLSAIATVVASLIAAYLGSWRGAKSALGRFKQERAFDRRLDWYERAARTLADTKLSIEVARTFEEDPAEPPDVKQSMWRKVQGMYIELTQTEALSELYAPHDVVQGLRAARERFDEVSDQTNGFDVHELPKHLETVGNLISVLEQAMARHASAVRAELGFEPLQRGKTQAPARVADRSGVA